MGTLYVVATPIGNLDDVTLRALRVLRDVAVIAAEDTRTTKVLLTRHGIRAKVVALTEHNTGRAVPRLIADLDRADVALVSDAGTPLVSDPGLALVQAAVEAGVTVSPIPGPSAALAALVVSGLSARSFTFVGFLPHAGGERRRMLQSLKKEPRTLIAFESPHRLRVTLADIDATFGDRPLAVCRELTKVYEEVYRGTAAGGLAHFLEPRGEVTLVIEGASAVDAPDEAAALVALAKLKQAGAGARDASA